MFNAGEKVECIDDSPAMGMNARRGQKLPIKKGETYVIRGTATNGGISGPAQILHLKGINMGINDTGKEYGFWCGRFAKIIHDDICVAEEDAEPAMP